MAEKLALPLILPNPPPSKPFFRDLAAAPPLPPPNLSPLFHAQQNLPFSTQRPKHRIGKHHDPNKGKPWLNHRLSPLGERTLHSLIDPHFHPANLDQELSALLSYRIQDSEDYIDAVFSDLLAIIEGLGFRKKCDLAMSVFDWIKNRSDSHKLINGSVVAVLITMLGKDGRISATDSLLHNLQKEGYEIDVYAYTSLITAFATNRRYREAIMVFMKMEEEVASLL